MRATLGSIYGKAIAGVTEWLGGRKLSTDLFAFPLLLHKQGMQFYNVCTIV